MTILVSGLTLFIGIHLFREFNLRNAVIDRFGAIYYRLTYSMIALIGLGLIIWGKTTAPFEMVYQPIYEYKSLSHIVMLPAFILVMAGNLPNSYIRRHTVHPMLVGTAIWGGAHLWANGDLASIILFGSIGLWAIIKFLTLIKLKPVPDNSASLTWDVMAVVLGFCVYGVVLVYHGQLFGIGLTFG